MLAWALVVLCGVCGLSGCSRQPAMGQTKPKPLVFAAYYVWYRTGDHARWPWSGWTRKEAESSPEAQKARRPGEPPLASLTYPLAGLYDSADPAVAAWHVQLAKAAGIDAFLVSWWDTHMDSDKAFETGILAAAERHGFKVARRREPHAGHHGPFPGALRWQLPLLRPKSPADPRPLAQLVFVLGAEAGQGAGTGRGGAEWSLDARVHGGNGCLQPDGQRRGDSHVRRRPDQQGVAKLPPHSLAIIKVPGTGPLAPSR